MEDGKFGGYTLFRQTSDTFLFDGDYMRITGAMCLTDNDGEHSFSLFHDQSSNSPTNLGGAFYIWGVGNYSSTPIVIGNNVNSADYRGIYLYAYNEDNRIATQGWVRDNAGTSGGTAIAVFG